MPLYEFQCRACQSRDEVFVRSVNSPVPAPACHTQGCKGEMQRVVSKFTRHFTTADQLAQAEARWGKEVDAAMGPEPDVGRYARRYEALAKDLPPPDEGVTKH